MESEKKKESKGILRKEAELGKQYERHIFAMISLKCLLDQDIEDFWIASNLAGIDKFDDVILHVTFKNKKKETFLIQCKYKKQNGYPMVSEVFITNKTDFNLRTYEEAYRKIISDKESLEIIESVGGSKIYFVLFTNRNIELQQKNEKLEFKELDKKDFKRYITSRTYEESTGFTILNKSGDNFDTEFLKNFYFYPQQLELDEVKKQIQSLLCGSGINTVFDEFLQYFYQYSDSKNGSKKITKMDLKLKLLSSTSVYGHFTPGNNINTSDKNNELINIIKKFNITIINDKKSEHIIWKEIWFVMQEYYKEKLENFTNWEEELPENVRNKYPQLEKEKLCLKKMYLFLVASGKLPFYKKTDPSSIDLNVCKLLTKLDVFSVICNTDKANKIVFSADFTVFQSMNDMDKKTFKESTERIFISFRDNDKIPLNNLLINDEVRKHISADQFIQYYNFTISIGSSVSTKKDIYINRTLMRKVIDYKSLIPNDNDLYIICNFPSNKSKKEKFVEMKDHHIFKTNSSEEYDNDSTEEIDNITTTPDSYSSDLLKKITTRVDERIFYIFHYEDGKHIQLLHTNGTINDLSPLLQTIIITDDDLVKTFNSSNINIICNNAGMGKSMLLRYLLKIYPKEEWLIYIEFSKYLSAVNKIKKYEDFIRFLQEIDIVDSVDLSFQNTFNCFYKSYVESAKLVLLIDDFEEICSEAMFDVLKEAATKGFRMWIVARPELKKNYETFFGVFTLELTEFTENDQIKFFKDFFKKESKIKQTQKLNAIKRITNTLDTSLIGICQQTMMLAEIFESDAETKITTTSELYEQYLKVTIEKYYSAKSDFVFRTLSKISLSSLYPIELLDKIYDKVDWECDLEVVKDSMKEQCKNPLVEFKKDRTPVFIHKTYAEYLAARWLKLTVERQVHERTALNVSELIRHLYSRELINVRWFFDKILANDIRYTDTGDYLSDILGRNIFHYSMTYGKIFVIKAHNNKEQFKKTNNLAIGSNEKKIIIRVPNEDNNQVTKFISNDKFINKYSELKTTSIEDKIQIFNKYSDLSRKEQCLTGTSISTELPALEKMSFTDIKLLLTADNFLKLTPIDYAILAGTLGNIEVTLTNAFIYENVNFSKFDEERYFMLFHAVKNGFNNLLKKLLTEEDLRDKIIMIRDNNNMSLLHLAVKYRKENCAIQLLDVFPATQYGLDNEGNTAVHLASGWKNINILKKLIICENNYSSTGNFINLKNNKGETPLFCFTQANNVEAVQILSSKFEDLDIDAVDQVDENSSFIASIFNKSPVILEILHNRKVNINLSNKKGMTALHYAILKRKKKFVSKLIKWKANLNCKNKYGITPLIFAARTNQSEFVRLLIEAGAKVNCVDKQKWTALHHAVRKNQINNVELLIKARANINSENNRGYTPYMMACIYNLPRVLGVLMDNIESLSEFNIIKAINICKKKAGKECLDIILKANITD